MAERRDERLVASLVAGIAACGLVACGSGAGTTASTAPPTTTVPADADDRSREVPGQANIFGAGADTPPDPGGGGAGVLPAMWPLPQDATVVTFPEVTGTVTPIAGMAEEVGPAGDGGRYGTTDISSFGGISGIVHERNGMFLVGVFLTDDPPPATAPERLDFTDVERPDSVEPVIGQTFLIGDGRGSRFRVPDGATRLFLGFADGYYYQGAPGWYGNNSGALAVTVDVETGRQ